MARKITFMGWVAEVPPRAPRNEPLNDHDLLRVVLLAEDSADGRWVVFKCESAEHAFKARRRILDMRFEVDIVQRYDMLYVRAWQ